MKFIKIHFKQTSRVLLLVMVAYLGVATTNYKEDNKYFEISKNIEIFTNLYKEINTFYVDDLDPSGLMRTGIDAMLESLDPYTNYISEAEIEGFRMIVKGKYSGIGATINKLPGDDFPFVTEPYEGFPAQKAGIKAGDILLEVDGRSTKDKTTNDISEILRGAPDSKISMKLRNPTTNKEYSVSVTRQEVRIPNVPYYGMVEGNVGYINLTTFTEQAGKNVENAVIALKKENPNLQGVIFDLRGNGGGLLIEAVNIANVFIPKGELVVTTRGKIKDWDRNFNTLNNPVDLDIPLAILVDEGSASASEIVAGVLQDLDRAVLIGQKSFGKGLVQNTRDVGFNSRVKMTTAKYYIPSGRCIQAVSYKDGKPVHIEDKDRASFKTKSGRPVLDGGGVTPDVSMDGDRKSAAIYGLLSKNLIFNYATQYAADHPQVAGAREFSITDGDYNSFVNYVNSQEYDYQTDSEKAVTALEKKAKAENYYDAIKNDITAMQAKIVKDKKNDLFKYKKEIKNLLEREIVSRYYYEKGRIQVGLKNDEEVKKAVDLLNDKSKYNALLSGK